MTNIPKADQRPCRCLTTSDWEIWLPANGRPEGPGVLALTECDPREGPCRTRRQPWNGLRAPLRRYDGGTIRTLSVPWKFCPPKVWPVSVAVVDAAVS